MALITIARDFRQETVIEKSRFICSLKKVATEEEAQAFIRAVKKEFWDATHNCSAYIVDGLAQRSSDDGEPAGTAGVPMLEVLRKNSLVGTAAVVTRYFGGVKLGAGGLVRAYSGSVANALKACGLAERVLLADYSLTGELQSAGRLLNILYRQQLFEVAGVEYGSSAKILLRMEAARREEAERWLTEQLNRPVVLEPEGETYSERPLNNNL